MREAEEHSILCPLQGMVQTILEQRLAAFRDPECACVVELAGSDCVQIAPTQAVLQIGNDGVRLTEARHGPGG